MFNKKLINPIFKIKINYFIIILNKIILKGFTRECNLKLFFRIIMKQIIIVIFRIWDLILIYLEKICLQISKVSINRNNKI